MPGNHFAGVKQLAKFDFRAGTGRVVWLPNYFEIIVEDELLILSHYPIASWRDMHRGAWHLHGHVHGAFKESLFCGSEGKVLDVGVEVCEYPISFGAVRCSMEFKKFVAVDHHRPS
jgi:calcineurin-like phosphoesterase family protein